MGSAEMKARLNTEGAIASVNTPGEFTAFIDVGAQALGRGGQGRRHATRLNPRGDRT